MTTSDKDDNVGTDHPGKSNSPWRLFILLFALCVITPRACNYVALHQLNEDIQELVDSGRLPGTKSTFKDPSVKRDHEPALPNSNRRYTSNKPAEPLAPSNSALSKRHFNSTHGLSIQFPTGWRVKPGAGANDVIKAVVPNNAPYEGHIIVAAYDLGVHQDLREIEPGWMISAIFQKGGTEIKVTESARTTLAGKHALWSVTSFELLGVKLWNLNVIAMRGTTMYLVYASTDASRAVFNDLRPLMEGSIQSFRFE